MSPKKYMLGLLATLLALVVADRPRIRFEFKTVSRIWTLVIVVIFSAFVVLVLLHGLDLLPEFLGIFSINMF